MSDALSADTVRKMDGYWRAANYLSVGQIYLRENPLLEVPLTLEHIKPRLLGHWGTTPGLNFIYAHLNRIIKRDDLSVLYVAGPGHGGNLQISGKNAVARGIGEHAKRGCDQHRRHDRQAVEAVG